MIRFVYIGLVLLLLAGIGYNYYHNNTLPPVTLPVPVVVELFTSTRCPSCPPAERILASLAKDLNVFAIGCHVPYLDYGTRKDPYSRDFCELRHYGYADLLTEKKLYTPFTVINGIEGMNGSHARAVTESLEKNISQPPQLISVTNTQGRKIEIHLPSIAEAARLRVWAFGIGESVAGEEDKLVTNPALTLDNLGSWDGAAQTLSMDVLDPDIRRIIVVAQENGYGRIVAAGRVELSNVIPAAVR